jgi:aryl-alcohol dehydrogenase-like predicted oxidoreductase
MSDLSRRHFIKTAAGVAVAGNVVLQTQTVQAGTEMPMRELGKTGEKVSILCLGGGGRGRNPQIKGKAKDSDERKLAVKLIERALEAGVNFFDSCTGYGASEEILGEALPKDRSKLFIATKNMQPAALGDRLRFELDQSLKRLKTDRLDLWYIHNVRTLKEAQAIFEKDRAIEVFQKAREEGKTRYIGLSGHTSAKAIHYVLDRCLKEDIQLDAALFNINIADAQSGGHGMKLIERYKESGIGLVAMKIFGSDGAPLLKQPGINAKLATRFVLSQQVSSAVVGIHTLKELEENLRIVKEFKPLTEEEVLATKKGLAAKPVWTLKA